jgi:hypothetical protein
MRNLILVDLDGTILKTSLEQEYKFYLLKKKGYSLEYIMCGLLATVVNKVFNLFWIPSVLSAWQIISNEGDVEDFKTEEFYSRIESEINIELMKVIRPLAVDNPDTDFLVLTGSPSALLSLKLKEQLNTYIKDIQIVGSELVHGSFIRKNQLLGVSKINYVLKNYPDHEKTYCIGNDWPDLAQRFIFRKMYLVKYNRIWKI